MPDEGVKDSVILGFRSFTTNTTTAAMAATKTTHPTTIPAKAPSEIFLPEPARLTVPAYVAVVVLPFAPLLTTELSTTVNGYQHQLRTMADIAG